MEKCQPLITAVKQVLFLVVVWGASFLPQYLPVLEIFNYFYTFCFSECMEMV